MEKEAYFEVVVAGIGGQGALTIGQILAEAGSHYYPYVSYFPNYGAAMRGGDSECTVILSSREIGAPAMLRPQAAIVMGDISLQEFRERVKPGGMLVIDSSLLPGKIERAEVRVCYVPATERALALGNRQVANFVLLGAYLEASGALPLEVVEQAVQRRLGGGRRHSLLELNKRALREGARFIAEVRDAPG